MDNSQLNAIKASETKDFYDKFWMKFKQKLTYAEVFRMHFIIDNILEFIPKTDLKILDLGCGRGWMAPFLSSFGSVTGIDFSPIGIKFAKNTYGQYANFILADADSPRLGIPDSKKFDLIICSEVIEHVLDHEALVKQLAEFMSPGGWCILTTPNGKIWPQYKSALQFVNYIFKKNIGFQPIENWINPEKLHNLFQRFNFFIIQHEGQTLYHFGIPPLIPIGYLEAQFVDILLRKFNLHHRYAKAILPMALYQIIIAKIKEQ